MNYGSIHLADCANGPGMRLSLFVSGCQHHCKGCFNQETWDFDYGAPYTPEIEEKIIATLSRSEYEGLTILGGEPLDPKNQLDVYLLVARVREYLDKSIWVYTGYIWEVLMMLGGDSIHKGILGGILANIDILVDGPFVEEEKDITLKFRGSRNQRIIDVQQSLREGRVILAEEWM